MKIYERKPGDVIWWEINPASHAQEWQKLSHDGKVILNGVVEDGVMVVK